nr:hypothetical protein [Tanacetum cinerariifolium]
MPIAIPHIELFDQRNQVVGVFVVYLTRSDSYGTEKCTMDVSATIWGLGPKGTTPGLLYGFLKDKTEQETEQARHIEG